MGRPKKEPLVDFNKTEPKKNVYLKPIYKNYPRPKKSHKPIRVLAIGDCHDSVELKDKSRFYAMGKYAKENNVDRIIQIGDFSSMDSMSFHEPNWTQKGQAKPSFQKEIVSFFKALSAFDKGLGGHKATKHVTLGNHEDRIGRFVNEHPELAELLYEKVYELLTDFGWDYSKFGELHFISDVAFTHVPFNTMGKPYGGKTSENQIGNDSLHDIVYGHSHKAVVKHIPKIGQDHVTVINLGCSLPPGYIEDYAKHSVTSWSYGVYDLTIRDGKIKEHSWVSMETLLKDYT